MRWSAVTCRDATVSPRPETPSSPLVRCGLATTIGFEGIPGLTGATGSTGAVGPLPSGFMAPVPTLITHYIENVGIITNTHNLVHAGVHDGRQIQVNAECDLPTQSYVMYTEESFQIYAKTTDGTAPAKLHILVIG